MQIFKSNSIEDKNLIRWTGTLIELKWFVQEICKKGICSHIKGIEKWQVAQNCFLVKKEDKWKKIEKYTMISNASGGDTKKNVLIEFGKKIASI